MGLVQEQRTEIVNEALSWVNAKTRYIGWSHTKGVGADCGQIIFGVYDAVGLAPAGLMLPTDYRIDVAQHRDSKEYVEFIGRYFQRIQELEAQIGDLVVYKAQNQLAFSHAGIIVEIRSPHDFDIVDAQLHGGVRVRHGYRNPHYHKASKRYYTLKDEFCVKQPKQVAPPAPVSVDATVQLTGVSLDLTGNI